jgi:hypothetical protein
MNMKKILVLICAISACTAVVTNDNEAKAQQGVVHVQGKHRHEVLTKKLGEGTWKHPKPSGKRQAVIDPGDVECYVDEANLNPNWHVDTTYLIIRWTEGAASANSYVWGYRYNPRFGDTTDIPHHTIDMIRAIAHDDLRFSFLVQYTGTSGHSIGGFGFRSGSACTAVPVKFDFDAAVESRVAFDYKAPLTCSRNGQLALPPDPLTLAQWAILIGSTSGFIEHPFDVSYGYPAYDYDYWILDSSATPSCLWQAGWAVNGYWAFYVGHGRQVPDATDPDYYADLGVTYQPLVNQDVHGFVFELNFGTYEFGEDFNFPGCDCPSCTTSSKRK